MHRFTRLFAATVVVVTVIASAAAAGTRTPRVDRREARQHVRIAQGVRSGELTRREALRLRAHQMRIRAMERRAKADGVVTLRERRRLNRALDRESRAIYRLKHNGRCR